MIFNVYVFIALARAHAARPNAWFVFNEIQTHHFYTFRKIDLALRRWVYRLWVHCKRSPATNPTNGKKVIHLHKHMDLGSSRLTTSAHLHTARTRHTSINVCRVHRAGPRVIEIARTKAEETKQNEKEEKKVDINGFMKLWFTSRLPSRIKRQVSSTWEYSKYFSVSFKCSYTLQRPL